MDPLESVENMENLLLEAGRDPGAELSLDSPSPPGMDRWELLSCRDMLRFEPPTAPDPLLTGIMAKWFIQAGLLQSS